MRFAQQPFKYLAYSVLIILLVAVAFVGSYTVSHAQPSRLQAEPTAIIDAVIQDLSQKLGKTFTRGTVDNWTWEQDTFPDAGLGCPQAGQTYPAGTVQGYKISITINGILYDYRARKDTSVFFLCSPAASSIQPLPSQPTPRPATAAPPATAIPIISTVAPINVPGTTPVVAPAGASGVELAYVAPDGNVHVRNIASGADTALTTDGNVHLTIQNALVDPLFSTTRSYGGLRWSPDGSKLLFVEFSTRTIYLALSGQAPVQIVGDYGLDHGFEMLPVWSPDGTQLVYAALAPNSTTKGQLLTVAPGSGQPPNLVTEFTVNVVNKNPIVMNATVAGFFDMAAFERDNHLSPPVLAWVDNVIIYGSDDGTYSLTAIDSQSGAVKWTANNLARVAISPDGKHGVAQVAAGDGPLGLIDLSTGQVTQQNTVKGFDRLVWSADSQSILYTTSAPGINIAPDPNSVLGKQLFQQYWATAGSGVSRNVQLWRLPISGGAPVQVFAHEGYQVGLIAPAPDGSGIVLSLITSKKPLIQALNTARTLADADQFLPHAELYYVPNSGTVVSAGIRLALGGQPALGIGSFVAVTSQISIAPSTVTAIPLVQSGATSAPSANIVSSANGQCPGAPPSRLAAGGTGRVTPGDPNLMRDQPSGTNTIGIIPAGAAFSVVQGPVCAANGVAWWQVTYNGVTGWTAEGQGSNYYLSP